MKQPTLFKGLSAERERIEKQLEEFKEKEARFLEEQKMLIGDVIVSALNSGRMSEEEFVALMTPLVKRKRDAQRLGIPFSKKSSLSDATQAEDEGDAMEDTATPEADTGVGQATPQTS